MAIEGASRPAYFTYDDHGHLLEEFIPSCNQANSHVWLDDILVGMVAPDYPCSPSSRRGILTDHLGAPVGATTGTTVGYPLSYEMYYSAFGIRLWTTVYDFMRVWRPGQLVNWNGDFWYNGYRDYVPAIGRYLQADPIGLAGGINPYTYVENNPLRWVDPFGLRTELIIWQPYGWGGSSFGHASGNIDGRNYSYGPDGWDRRKSAADYARRQQEFRSGTGSVIGLTPTEEAAFERCLQTSQGKYDGVTDNCVTPFKDCLRNIGLDPGYPLFPADFGDALRRMDRAREPTFYPGPNRGWIDNIKRGDLPDAPWAR